MSEIQQTSFEMLPEQNAQQVRAVKIRNVIYSLCGVIFVQVAFAVYGVVMAMKVYAELSGAPEAERMLEQAGVSWYSFFSVFTAVWVVASVLLIKELKNETLVGWLGSVFLLLMVSPSFCLPFSIWGLLNLLSDEVRKPFFDELKTKI